MPDPEIDAGDLGGPTRSAIVACTVTGHHLLDIDGYSYTKLLPTGKHIKSRTFRVGGRPWCIHYYPNGGRSTSADYISIYLIPGGSFAEPVKARVRFSLLDQAGNPVPSHTRDTDLCNFSDYGYGFDDFVKRDYLEKSEHLKDDCFTIRCDVIIFKELDTEDRSALLVEVPPSDLHRHLGNLLAAEEGTDVTFEVAGVTFTAHRCVLAARSPVFKAELFGVMKERTEAHCIRIDDIRAEVFKNLLHFIYTDSLPKLKGREEAVMAQHLLVAADRYDIQRLKVICEERLCRHIDVGTAATTLALAEQHHCHGLKGVCIEFLKSPTTLDAVMATDGFEHLAKSCPALLMELMSKLAARSCGKRKLRT